MIALASTYHLSDATLYFAWGCYQMEPFSAVLVLCERNPAVTCGFPHKGQWLETLMFSLIYTWTNDWVNNRDTGELRCHHAHYDVTVMENNIIKSIVSEEASFVSQFTFHKKFHSKCKSVKKKIVLKWCWKHQFDLCYMSGPTMTAMKKLSTLIHGHALIVYTQ